LLTERPNAKAQSRQESQFGIIRRLLYASVNTGKCTETWSRLAEDRRSADKSMTAPDITRKKFPATGPAEYRWKKIPSYGMRRTALGKNSRLRYAPNIAGKYSQLRYAPPSIRDAKSATGTSLLREFL